MTLEGERFRDAVTSRAKELGRRTDALLAAAGGPSTTTMTKLRHGDYRPRRDTMEKFDTALQWEPGSAWRVWNGGEPTPNGAYRWGADKKIVAFELSDHRGVHVVVKGPVTVGTAARLNGAANPPISHLNLDIDIDVVHGRPLKLRDSPTYGMQAPTVDEK